ncbi:MAG TPA: CsgG/HfaB family protein [Vicinamibacterales bacterium]|nr:CsgG/HfaB family protein [Vicinamibacterales bacterium]
MNELCRVVVVAGVVAGGVFSPVIAGAQVPAPSVAVAGFIVDSASKLPVKATDAMVDGVALQMVESGRYRVMDRTWLGVASGAPFRESTTTLRDRAREAGVAYLVIGRVSKYRDIAGYGSPSTGIVPQGRPHPGFGRAPLRSSPRYVDRLRVTLELVDVETGQVLTEGNGSCLMPKKPAFSRTAALAVAPSSPLLAIAALAMRARSSSVALDAGLERALATAGQTLVRWTSGGTK